MQEGSNSSLRLDRLHYPVRNLGPGVRVAIWTAGCLKRCPGCLSPSLLPLDSGHPVPVAWLAEKILKLRMRPTGLTVTGGEPFLQAGPLAELWDRLIANGKMDWMVYTGYTLEELRKDSVATGLLERIDLLVDGEYRSEQPTDLVWRGSANQRLHLLSRRAQTLYRHLPFERYGEAQSMGLDVDTTGAIYMTGIPRPGDLETIEAALQQRGVSWRHE